ncbi:MAG: signal recognition particle-docking protein FtsY [Myxococcaceae bacterium]|nr:signal recognition particle-docking protein FtsY [Myxococcaceae bacterium]
MVLALDVAPSYTDPSILVPAGIAAAVVVLGLVVWRASRRKAPPPADTKALTEAPALPKEPIKVELPPSELEAQKRAEQEVARAAAQEAVRARLALEREAKEKGITPEALEAQTRALKDKEEDAKKEAYRAQKAAEAEAKERRQREKEEAARLEAEAKAKAIADEEARKAALLAEEKARAALQSGQTLAAGLSKTRSEGFIAKLNGLFGGAPRAIDEKVLGELEETLFTADIGVKTASALVELARDKAKKNELSSADGLKAVIRKEVARIVDLQAKHALAGGGPPHVVMVVGVNGSGKTTTIGKLAAKATAQGKKVLLAAGDTFRAAATEQLDVWAERAGATLVKGKDEGDPAAVVFDAIKRAAAEGFDLVLADTAGRLHTAAPLMEELKKVKRVIDKALPGAPHEVLLVLDSTNGQNAIHQARQFHDAVGVTSIALTKLDGTAKGGVIIGICDELKVPVAWAGVGEKVADLRPFAPKEFVEALFD